MSKSKGIFITFEGPECAGKTTQIKILSEYCKSINRKTLVTREPGGTEVGEELRYIVKHHVGETAVTDEAEVLLFGASRAQHVSKVIKPALDRGEIVICDRFADSTTSYQGYARGLDMDFINRLNEFAICGCMPNITFLLDLTAEESMERSSNREETQLIEDRIESEKLDFHKHVREGFLKIAAENPQRVKIISAIDSIDNIHQKIIRHLSGLL
jgi:dTMP kinase